MIIYKWGLLTLILCSYFNIFGQKLRKSDRTIVANMQSHVKYLAGDKIHDRTAGSDGEKTAGEYVGRHFERSGLKPMGDGNSWYQKVEIYDGKQLLPGTSMVINGNKLRLHDDYFPFPFSADKKTEAAIAIALAENGVPWFKDLRELTDNDEDTMKIDTMKLIREKAIAAADKGASALVIYNSGSGNDLRYDKYDPSPDVTIPVIYLKKEAFKKYCSDESEIIDISLTVAKKAVKRTGMNVIGYADNKSDSTVIAGAPMDNETEVAALLELARLMKQQKGRHKNYLFIAYSNDKDASRGLDHYKQHPAVDPAVVSKMVDIDTITVKNENPKSLHLVKQSVELIR